jgi:ABC-type transporter Mla subunit MlaD
VQLPSGAKLQHGNEVREGGYRIGIVDAMQAVRLPDGTAGAEARIKLDQAAWALPRDTTVAVRGRSILGLKYLDIRRGASPEKLPDNGLIRADDAMLSHDLDRFLGMYDRATRNGARRALKGFGGALAMRGQALNRTLEIAPAMLRHLDVTMTVLAAPETKLGRFVSELGDAARALAPVAGRYAHSFAAGADTFAAMSADPGALDTTLRRIPPALRTGTASFRRQRPLLRQLGRVSVALDETAQRLPSALPRLTALATTGAAALPAGTRLNERAVPVLASLREFAQDPGSRTALDAATRTNGVLAPLTRFVGPYITVCNAFNYAFTYASDTASEPDLTGTSTRSMIVVPPREDNSMGSIGASEPANGQNVITGSGGFLHQTQYSAAVDRQGNADCESGQRGYMHRLNAFGDPKFKTVVDPHIPGNQGPTFTGRARVPAGETFSRAPQLGPSMPAGLDP